MPTIYNFYVDSVNGADGNNGTDHATPKQHIKAVLELAHFTSTITDPTYIHLFGTAASPRTFDEADDEIDLKGLECSGDDVVIFQSVAPSGVGDPGSWHQEEYEDGVTFDELSERIRPVYYARINGGGHSIFFVTWCDAGRNPIRFQDRADPDEALFLALGGNQDDRVSLARNSVTRSGTTPSPGGGIEWNAASHDGFGDTSGLWHNYP